MTTEQSQRFEELKQKGFKTLVGEEREEYSALKKLFDVQNPKEDKVEETKQEDTEQMNLLKQQVKMLSQLVDTSKLTDQQKEIFGDMISKKPKMPVISLSFYNDLRVVSWETVNDKVSYYGSKEIEDQRMKLNLEDGSSVEILFIDMKNLEKRSFELEEEPTLNKQGVRIYRVTYKNEIISVPHTFIN